MGLFHWRSVSSSVAFTPTIHTEDRGVYGDVSQEEYFKKRGPRTWAFTPTIRVCTEVFHQRSVLIWETFTPTIGVSLEVFHQRSVLRSVAFVRGLSHP